MTYQDTYIEGTAQREKKTSDMVIYVLIWVMLIAMIFLSLLFPIPFMIVAALDLWLIYYQRGNMGLAFDYAITNDEIDIVRVTGKRKLLVSAKVDEIQVLAPSKSEPLNRYNGVNMPTKDCTSHSKDTPYYTMIIRDQDTKKESKVLWEPNEEMLDYLKRRNPRNVFTRKDLHLD